MSSIVLVNIHGFSYSKLKNLKELSNYLKKYLNNLEENQKKNKMIEELNLKVNLNKFIEK